MIDVAEARAQQKGLGVRNLCAFYGCSTTAPVFGSQSKLSSQVVKFSFLVSTSGIPHFPEQQNQDLARQVEGAPRKRLTARKQIG